MTAKEMFEKLGYEYKEYYSNHTLILISYEAKPNNEYNISFYMKRKTFYKEDDYAVGMEITLEELQAINKQIEELGWNKC